MKRLFLAALLIVSDLEVLVAQTTEASEAKPPSTLSPGLSPGAPPPPPAEPRDYKAGAGDTISLIILPATEYSREVTVPADGIISLPLIGEVSIKGLTADQIAAAVQEKYVRYVANPKVTAMVRRLSGRRIAILGEVKGAGFYDFHEGMRILELVSLAGGVSDYAKTSRVKIIRPSDPAHPSFTVNLRAVLAGDLSRNVLLAAGDTVYIPKSALTRNTQWVNTNIVPWLSLVTLITSIVILQRQ